ncbi:MAG: DUF255 domain-containing protein [Vicinamibacteria bacterium]
MKPTFLRLTLGSLLICLTAAPSGFAATSKPGTVAWRGWTDTVFADARREKRLVILDLEAIWCHWCHVMDETTYADPEVAAILGKGYIAVKVDQDSRPDMSNRYEDYGWPATILFDSHGQELAKLSGYIPKERMRVLLQAFIDDPTPGPSVISERKRVIAMGPSALAPSTRAELIKDHTDNYDVKYGSWGTVQKFLASDPMEYTMELAGTGDVKAHQMAIQTLDGQLSLIDPVWGGVYQYSHGGVWTNPHFEKIMSVQSTNLRIYALAFAQFQDLKYRTAAVSVRRYLKTFLTSPQGAFFTSQDADQKQGEHAGEYFALNDAGRRRGGMPRIDTNIYARENGWAIEALAAAGGLLGEKEWVDEAVRAADWIIQNRSLPGGGFRHGGLAPSATVPGPYLGDTLAMSRAFLQLYATTADRVWLKRAEESAKFIATNFASPTGKPGFVTVKARTGAALTPLPQRDENIQMARFANLLSHYTGNKEYRTWADKAMTFLSAPEVAERRPAAGVLLVDRELTSDPTHITIVGSKTDPEAQRLFASARQFAGTYMRIEFWDNAAEGPMPNPDVTYPQLKRAAAFACASGRCSAPIYDAPKIAEVVNRFQKAE